MDVTLKGKLTMAFSVTRSLLRTVPKVIILGPVHKLILLGTEP